MAIESNSRLPSLVIIIFASWHNEVKADEASKTTYLVSQGIHLRVSPRSCDQR